MSFTNSNDYITGRKPLVQPSGSELVSVRFTVAVPTGDLALNTIGQIGALPAGCVPVNVRIDASDIDSGAAAAVFQVGVLDAAGTAISTAAADGGGAWGDSGAAVNTAFDKEMTRTLNNMNAVTSSGVNRNLALKVTTAPTTAVAGTLGVTLTYRAA